MTAERAPILADFQQAAVELIAERLTSQTGSRRFLLADEVGLGKTIVARHVILRLAQSRRRRDPFNVVYLCSNAEIAEQNRSKLEPSGGRSYRRVSELAVHAPEGEAEVSLYAFTPGTSLHASTGIAWERRLMLYLVGRVLGHDVSRKRWTEFFRCGVTEENWEPATRPRKLAEDFFRQTTIDFQQRLAVEWREADIERDGAKRKLTHVLADIVAEHDQTKTAMRNAAIRQLRLGLQKAALDSIKPHLVILDEVQRFRDILEVEGKEHSLERRLFQDRNTAVLILSATPYRLLTRDHETEGGIDHYEDFLQTLRFLFREGEGETDPALARIRSNLGRYGARLKGAALLAQDDSELRDIKQRLEADLKRVVCRTERNWYVEDVLKGVEAVGLGSQSTEPPPEEELAEFIRLRRFLNDEVDSAQHITEFWKSCPAILTFMDLGYVLMKHLRDSTTKVPPALIATGTDEIEKLAARSFRFRAVLRAAFGGSDGWRFLWVKPTYTYYEDGFYRGEDPPKLLVFSGWRFVPKAVSVLLSAEAARRVGRDPFESDQQPLRFSVSEGRVLFAPFDVLFPSVALARAVPLAQWACEGPTTADALTARAEAAITGLLLARGIEIGDTRNAPFWRIIARLESMEPDAVDLCGAARSVHVQSRVGDDVEAFEKYRDVWLEWLKDTDSPLRISREYVKRLAKVAIFSPAISLLRAYWTALGPRAPRLPPALLSACLMQWRTFWNRPLTRAIVNRHAERQGTRYTERVLAYCRDAHVQAVLDEYLFLLGESASLSKLDKLFETIARVLGVSPGKPHTNGRKGSGARVTIAHDETTHATHWALAFGDQSEAVEDYEEGESGAGRKTAVREGFNSPFLPFVLATTSVGQEGLDFHLYCRDIVHWNLPWNPVDLEQREGRIQRRNCLAIRRSIANDWPLAALGPGGDGQAVWQAAFDAIGESDDLQLYKHGMFPNWVYECRDKSRTYRIRRHLPFHPASEDAARYAQLKRELALYRLVFGQPRQDDLLEHLTRQLDAETDRAEAATRRLPGYMVNLSPFPASYARERARREAEGLVGHADARVRLPRLLDHVRAIRAENTAALGCVDGELDLLTRIVSSFMEGDRAISAGSARLAVAALVYLRNPYDGVFDVFGDFGFEDDVREIRWAHQRLTRGRHDRTPTERSHGLEAGKS
ncbi:MAG TPA: DEAD/DEAH box helicase family protein [Polyangiaceae bacterium]|jgi:hypothetical protein